MEKEVEDNETTLKCTQVQHCPEVAESGNRALSKHLSVSRILLYFMKPSGQLDRSEYLFK